VPGVVNREELRVKKFLLDVWEWADAKSKGTKVSPALFLHAYKRMAEGRPAIRFANIRDRHWSFLSDLFPDFKIKEGDNLEKFKKAILKVHPKKDIVSEEEIGIAEKGESDAETEPEEVSPDFSSDGESGGEDESSEVGEKVNDGDETEGSEGEELNTLIEE